MTPDVSELDAWMRKAFPVRAGNVEMVFVASALAEDRFGAGASFEMRADRRNAFAQASAEDGMRRIGRRFLETRQAVMFRRGASPQVAVLGEDEPHPVAVLVPGAELRQRLFEHAA